MVLLEGEEGGRGGRERMERIERGKRKKIGVSTLLTLGKLMGFDRVSL